MIADDHAINSLKTWFDIAYQDLKKEWVSDQYEKLSDCPSFKLASTYHEAITVLYKGSNFPDIAEKQLKSRVTEELEFEERLHDDKK
ncbi:hypothetical protein [Cytobacillus oceanisediminis]|uniref:hypothetical protein n=1 Tax=Cytobacillus oceanisediminis TaxID=665099 RepID=UPI0020407C9B|nr:hypothetical protein [Cytobacillus oceanisediminis]MCM3405485.1 hypothetical protein [Cytobacillus oceanisediminis]